MIVTVCEEPRTTVTVGCRSPKWLEYFIDMWPLVLPDPPPIRLLLLLREGRKNISAKWKTNVGVLMGVIKIYINEAISQKRKPYRERRERQK